MIKLNRAERDILESFERGEWTPIPNVETEKKRARKSALRTLKKQRLHIEISSKDFVRVQKRAIKEGVRSEALISKVVHQYVSGQLIDKKNQHK